MSFWYNNNLKIEFRAVPYASTSHVLEFRISPDQDLNYEVEKSFFGIKYKKKNKYKTNWHKPRRFLNYPGAWRYDEEDCYLPIFVRNRKDLENFKSKYKTIGEFFDWIDRENKREKDEWQTEQANYAKEHIDWY